jgi:CheY-like chemotaxis protein
MTTEEIIDREQFNHHTILLAEDNEDDVLIMQSTFRKAAVPNPLQVVSDGDQAIAYLKGEAPYSNRQRYPLPVVILLDLNMPRKNGFEVLAWIRADPNLRRTTVDILTASSRTVDVERALDLGANSYIIKPSKVDALVEMIKAWHTFSRYKAFPAH